uniref:L1 transposable element RRM domain-containing protein n=1 Tax=Micrurus lemniscatus lemniscatus TaxID=129467 RepID=A0A2D4ILK3_MICLE
MGRLEEKVGNVEGKVGNTEEKVENIQQLMMINEEHMGKIEERADITEKRIEEMDYRLTLTDQSKKKKIILLEMDRADYYLRFQNIEEEKEENLAEIIADLLAGALEVSKEKVIGDIDEIFRVQTRYALKNKLPREVHVRFTKKVITEILQKARDDTLKYRGKVITVLKQIPRNVKDLRRKYQFLTKCLIKRGINFRWLIPEGIMVTWHEQRHRLDSGVGFYWFCPPL